MHKNTEIPAILFHQEKSGTKATVLSTSLNFVEVLWPKESLWSSLFFAAAKHFTLPRPTKISFDFDVKFRGNLRKMWNESRRTVFTGRNRTWNLVEVQYSQRDLVQLGSDGIVHCRQMMLDVSIGFRNSSIPSVVTADFVAATRHYGAVSRSNLKMR